MPKFIDITGQRYGRLVAVRQSDVRKQNRVSWVFRCDCGQDVVTTANRVRTGNTKSCGCLALETLRDRATTHGHTIGRNFSHEYYCWAGAKARCSNSKHIAYARYGARGILMCEKWAASFDAFFSDMGPCPDGHTLDRIENDKGYEPGNCRWATPAEQVRNKSDSVKVIHNGVGMNLKDYAESLGINYRSLRVIKHRHGYTPEQAAEHLLSSSRTRTRPSL